MLMVRFDQRQIYIGDRFSLSFQRTLRIPENNQIYPLPPGLGVFPIRKVEDYRDRLPGSWRGRSGIFIPMYQREALWLGFDGTSWKPNAVQIGVGGINAISGKTWKAELRASPQNYIVCPPQ